MVLITETTHTRTSRVVAASDYQLMKSTFPTNERQYHEHRQQIKVVF
jgi:hypothetical protein